MNTMNENSYSRFIKLKISNSSKHEKCLTLLFTGGLYLEKYKLDDKQKMKRAMLVSGPPRWCHARSWSPDRFSEPTEVDGTWQEQGAGVAPGRVPLPPDFLSRPAGHIHVPDG